MEKQENEKKLGIEDLILKGKKNNGMLTSADIDEALEDMEYDNDSLDKLYETLEDNGISIHN